ncbi:MAG: hypothetical protein NVS1B4_20260 [Gemmatimonadaceae bacterium]
MRHTIVAALLIFAAAPSGAQVAAERKPAPSAAEHIALGDQAHVERDAAGALAHYQAALLADSTSYEAMWKGARESVDLGEAEGDAGKRGQLYAQGEAYARRAVATRRGGAEGHFHLARSIGRTALTMGTRERVRYATVVFHEARAALAIDSLHPGANHVLGVWNAEVMRLSGFSRMVAKKLLGGAVFGEASWGNAVRYMERSVSVDPARIVHRVDLAKIYRDIGDRAKATASLDTALSLPVSDYNDKRYQEDARATLAGLK